MEDININFNIFGENETFELTFELNFWLMAVLSPVKKRKREPKNNTKDAREGKRHKELDDREIDKIEEDRHEVNTKRSTVWALAVFKDWLVQKNMSADFDSYGKEKLNQMLRSFYASVRNANGKTYSISSYIAIRSGICRHYTTRFDIMNSATFKSSDRVFKSVIKNLRQNG